MFKTVFEIIRNLENENNSIKEKHEKDLEGLRSEYKRNLEELKTIAATVVRAKRGGRGVCRYTRRRGV